MPPIQLVEGRPLPEDESTVAVISHALWATWFGSDPDVIGRSYKIGYGPSRTVIGVRGPEFRLPNSQTVLWLPLLFNPNANDVVPRFDVPPAIGPGRRPAQGLVARMAPGEPYRERRRANDVS